MLRKRRLWTVLVLALVVMVVMSLVYSMSSYPAGALSDRLGRRGLLAAGLLVLIAADLFLGFGRSIAMALAGVALWGLHMGLTQGILSTLVADTAPVELRGTAFGMFNLVSGLAMLLASVIAGVLWQGVGSWEGFGPSAPFLFGGTMALAAALLMTLWMPRIMRMDVQLPDHSSRSHLS